MKVPEPLGVGGCWTVQGFGVKTPPHTAHRSVQCSTGSCYTRLLLGPWLTAQSQEAASVRATSSHLSLQPAGSFPDLLPHRRAVDVTGVGLPASSLRGGSALPVMFRRDPPPSP